MNGCKKKRRQKRILSSVAQIHAGAELLVRNQDAQLDQVAEAWRILDETSEALKSTKYPSNELIETTDLFKERLVRKMKWLFTLEFIIHKSK